MTIPDHPLQPGDPPPSSPRIDGNATFDRDHIERDHEEAEHRVGLGRRRMRATIMYAAGDVFESRAEVGRATIDPGLFYRLQVGALLELVCVDTTWGAHHPCCY